VNARFPGGLEVAARPRLCVGSSVTIVSHWGTRWEPKGNAAVVLALVALEGHADRRRTSAMLWPASPAAQARSNLRVLTHRVNHRFGSELLAGTERLELDASQVHVELHDAEVILQALEAGGAARCELLADAGLNDVAGEELQAWLDGARQRLLQLQLARLSEAGAQALALGRHERAVTLARACVQLDPLSEHRHRQLMDVLVRGGDRAAALAAYEACKDVLKQHLGVLPGLQTRTVQLHILQEQAPGVATQGEPQTPETDGLASLGGAARYPLVERDAVLAQAQAALRQGVHIVVQGEPGVGKTRLLRQLAASAGGDVEAVAIRCALKQAPYGALAQLLQEVQPRRAPVVGVPEQIELARLAPLAFSEVQASEAALSVPRLHAALGHWLARLADAGVRVLVLDDVQYADAASQAALASVLEAGVEAPVGAAALLLAHRSGETDAVLDDAVTLAQTRHRAQRVALPRLTLVGVQMLLRAIDARQRTSEPGVLAQRLHQRTGGNPLFVIELARQALEHGAAADGANLQALLQSSLEGCSALAQQLAAVAAVAAADFTVELAAAVTGRTALELMPAWRELRQRGLFAEHGLAHDLVQDAVLAQMPQAILQLLHRQVGQCLESQGVRGWAVLRHWLAANDADRALPHAVHQLHAGSAAGLPTTQQELQMLSLLECSSDAVLMDNLWLTADIAVQLNHDFRAAQVWSRLRALRHRVEQLVCPPPVAEYGARPPRGHATVLGAARRQLLSPPQAGASWVAFETARERFFVDQSVADAHQVLAAAAERMAPAGVERAHIEHAIAGCLIQTRGDPRAHLARAKAALADLPDHISLKRVRRMIDASVAIFLDPLEGIRAQAARWRAGRRRGDMALAADAGSALAFIHGGLGNHAQSFRHWCRSARAQPGGCDTDRFPNRYLAGASALNSGHYAIAQRLLTASEDATLRGKASVMLALLPLRLGEIKQAALRTSLINLEAVGSDIPVLMTHAQLCAELDHLEGRDPVPALRRRLQRMRSLGMDGVHLDLASWEIMLRTHSASQRLDAGETLLSALRRAHSPDVRHLPLLIDVAEARAETHACGAEDLAAEAARYLMRGFTRLTLYLPEGLVRCARLCAGRDPRRAHALVHVARRWVCNALEHVPQESRESFMRNVAVNRLLLLEDEPAIYTEPLR
jgi:DNA-binding SARP family transcriptional activator